MLFLFFFFFKQKTAYEMRISDWSSDVCSSDLLAGLLPRPDRPRPVRGQAGHLRRPCRPGVRDRRDPARGGLAALPHPLRREPDVCDPEELVEIGRAEGRARVWRYV